MGTDDLHWLSGHEAMGSLGRRVKVLGVDSLLMIDAPCLLSIRSQGREVVVEMHPWTTETLRAASTVVYANERCGRSFIIRF